MTEDPYVDASALAAVRDLSVDETTALLAAACEAAGSTLVDVRPRGLHDRAPRTCSRVYDVTMSVNGVERETLLVVHASERTPPGDTLQLVSGRHRVHVWRFPNDPYLPGLPAAVSRRSVRRLLDTLGVPEGEVTLRTRAYRPGRRAVVEVHVTGDATAGRALYLKVLSGDRAEQIAEIHRALDGIVPVPRVVGVDPVAGILAIEALGGQTLRSVLHRGQTLPDTTSIVALSESIAASNLASSNRPTRFADPRRHVDRLSRVLPDLARDIERVARTSHELESATVPVHGDLHDAQILVTDDRVTGLLDVDGAGPGHMARDAANLLVRIEALVDDASSDRPSGGRTWTQSLTSAYEDLVGRDDLRRARAGAWLSLATGPRRAGHSDWLAETRSRVERAIETLHGT